MYNKQVTGGIITLLFVLFLIYEPDYKNVNNIPKSGLLVFAHRGFGNYGPDNSLAAVRMAIEAEIDGVDQATLAGLIAYDRATITGVVDRLVQKGYIERVVSTRDRRARELHLTDKGRDTFAKVSPAVLQAQKSMLTGLDGAEQSELLRLMAKAIEAGNEQSRAPLRSD